PPRPSTVRHEGLVTAAPSSPMKPIVMGLGAVAAVVVAILAFKGIGDSTPPPPPPRPDPVVKTGPSNPGPSTSVESADKLKKDVADFRRWSEGQITASTPDRFTGPHSQLQKKIDGCKAESNFGGLTAWQEERGSFVDRANKFITERVWEPIRMKADENLGAGRLSKALDELAKFEDVFKYLGEGRQEKTRATLQLEDRLQKIEASADQAWLEGKQNADRQFAEASTRDQAYTSLDILTASLLPRQRKDVEDARRKYFESEVGALVGTVPTPEKIKQAQGRVAKLRGIHSGNEAATGELDRTAAQLKEAYENFSKGALAQANSLYAAGFKPKFEEAMRQRDLVSVRRHLTTIYYSKETASLQTYLLPASIDPALLKSFCDPARVAPLDTRKLVAQAEEGFKVASKPGQSEGARDLYFDLRTILLVEDLVEQSLEGARLAGRDAGKFKTGYSAQLKDAISADPLPRKPLEGVSLSVAVVQGGGRATINLSVFPRKDPVLSEDDLVALAKRAPTAANDPYFALKAFFLCHYGGKLASAKAWYEKLPPEHKAGVERLAEGLKDVVSATAEVEAKQLYEDGHAAWRKKDEAGAIRKFRECLEKYGHTSYMKVPVKLSTGEKSRIQIIEETFKLTAPAGVGPKSAGKAKLTDVFNAAEVRDLGKGRYDITWLFKEDRELAAFQTVPGAFGGQISAVRGPAGGVRLGGGGIWSGLASFKGDVLFEVSFKMDGEKALGFIVHGKGDQAGYAVLVDLEIPGAGQLDAVFRMPINLGPQLLTSILAQGGKDLDVVKDLPSTARLERTGTKIRLAVNRGTIEADNAQFNDGRVGLLIPDSSLAIDKIRVVGEVDKAWFEAAVRAADSAAPPK
ncbi:MAG TPA: hypothetical protein VJB14_06855, partial [Planctomycetota bacterium]|nr:hypothetical protein [Planctomycetota bacterium]